MKVIAMYLPQFHRIKENDEWWGDGFTEWVSAKKAKPLFEGHYQPHIPQDDNYYDLLQKKTMEWQSDLMKQYGVDGVCIYHYYFKDGRKILEKPAENLLKWRDISMPFCFCWANETWARTWANLQGANVWSVVDEENGKEKEKAVLLEQSYGTEKDWKEHFEYLNTFFVDERYIKIDGKPLFVIYKAKDISCLTEMILCWQECAKRAGWEGLFIIGGNYDKKSIEALTGVLICEPSNEIGIFQDKLHNDTVSQIEYSDVWDCILDNDQEIDIRTYYCGVVGYDDTPRRGSKGKVLINNSPSLFQNYITKLMGKSIQEGNEFMFINAWNEWGEGMHLEPDKKYGYAYLQALKQAKQDCQKRLVLNKNANTGLKRRLLLEKTNKFELYLNTLDIWLQLLEHNCFLDKYLVEHGYKRVGIYGYGVLGRHLVAELENTEVETIFLVDKQKERLMTTLPVFSPNEELPQNDIIIVTSFYYFEEIRDALSPKNELISLKDIIDDVWNSLS